MSTEEKKKIQAWVPVSIWIQIESFGFKSQNEAVNIAFEKLIEIQDNNQVESKENQNDSKNNQLESDMINQLQANIEGKDKQLEETQRQIKNLENSAREKSAEILRLQGVIQELPDRAELAELKGLYEGKLQVIEEKDKRIEGLEREVNDLRGFTHYFQNVEYKQLPEKTAGNEVKKKWWKFW